MVPGESVGIDVLRGQASSHGGSVFGNCGLRNGAGDRRSNPTGNTEEVQHVLNDHDEHNARQRLGEAGNRRHENLNRGEHVNLDDKGEDVADEKRNEHREDVIEPVLHEIWNN